MRTYRNGKLTSASFSREMRYLNFQENTMNFQWATARNQEEKEKLEKGLAKLKEMKSELLAEYNKYR